MSLCDNDLLKIDEATEQGISKALTFLSYLRDKDRIKK
tara:strand:- start:5008 stop:5121 length:114 start_codon:yes stop_codon:yes gene_type:complete